SLGPPCAVHPAPRRADCPAAPCAPPWPPRRFPPWSGSRWSPGCACAPQACLLRSRQDRYSRLLDDAVDEPVLDRLLRREEEIAVGVALNPLEGLAGVLGDQLVQHAPDPDDLAGVDIEVAGLALEALAADQGLMHMDVRARKRE